jgi:hypothetical protein
LRRNGALGERLCQHIERFADSGFPHSPTTEIAEVAYSVYGPATRPGHSEMDKSDRFRLRRTAWTRNACNRYRNVGARMTQRALRHGNGDRRTHRTMRPEQFEAYAERLGLGFI